MARISSLSKQVLTVRKTPACQIFKCMGSGWNSTKASAEGPSGCLASSLHPVWMAPRPVKHRPHLEWFCSPLEGKEGQTDHPRKSPALGHQAGLGRRDTKRCAPSTLIGKEQATLCIKMTRPGALFAVLPEIRSSLVPLACRPLSKSIHFQMFTWGWKYSFGLLTGIANCLMIKIPSSTL